MAKRFGAGGVPKGLTIQTGSRGGKYHITASGNKSYTPLSDKKQLHVVDGQLTTADEVNALAKKHGVSHHSQIPGYQGEYGAGGKKQKIAPPPPPKPVPPPRPAKPVPPPKPVPAPVPPPKKAALPPKPPPRPVPPPAPPKPVMPDPAKLFNEPPPQAHLPAGAAGAAAPFATIHGYSKAEGLYAKPLSRGQYAEHIGLKSDVRGADALALAALERANLVGQCSGVKELRIKKGSLDDRVGGSFTVIRSYHGDTSDPRIMINHAFANNNVEGGQEVKVERRLGHKWEAVYSGKKLGPFVMGEAHTVYPNKGDPGGGLHATVIHEASHAWAHTAGMAAASLDGPKYRAIQRAHVAAVLENKTVSKYAAVSADEWFAETHTAYVLHNKALKEYHPDSWRLMRSLRKDSGMPEDVE